MYTYPIRDNVYKAVEMLGSYKARLIPVKDDNPRLRSYVAQVGDDWWFCREDWTVVDNYECVRDHIGNQLNEHCAQYLVDLIVGVSPIAKRNSDD